MRYPAHIHQLSPALTLQGAVAHVDMPVETGPTLYLPHSQKYPARLHRLPPAASSPPTSRRTTCSCRWRKGDAAFFNPALFHGAGTNRSRGRTADGQPAAGVVGVRPGDGDGRPDGDERGALPGAADVRRQRGERHRRLRRGVRLPHQPRPRPADRRPGPADPGRAGATGAGREAGTLATLSTNGAARPACVSVAARSETRYRDGPPVERRCDGSTTRHARPADDIGKGAS